jgi:hypothetical protein
MTWLFLGYYILKERGVQEDTRAPSLTPKHSICTDSLHDMFRHN